MQIISIAVPIIEHHIADHFFELEKEVSLPVQWRQIRKHCRMIMNKYKTISRLLKRRGLFTEAFGRNLCQICIMLHRMEQIAISRDINSIHMLRPMHQEITDLGAELSCRLHELIHTPVLRAETAD